MEVVTALFFCIFILSLAAFRNTNLIERFYPEVNLCNEGSSIHVESNFFFAIDWTLILC